MWLNWMEASFVAKDWIRLDSVTSQAEKFFVEDHSTDEAAQVENFWILFVEKRRIEKRTSGCKGKKFCVNFSFELFFIFFRKLDIYQEMDVLYNLRRNIYIFEIL